jgi:transcriptional regulator GlxA family with amidase domain
MKVAFILYDKVTLLDFAGLYDPISRLKTMGFCPDLEYVVSSRTDQVRSSEGLVMIPDDICTDFTSFDYVVIPGGDGVKDLMKNPEFIHWISTVGPDTTIAAVCGGVLLLGAAGLLRDSKATTHPSMQPVLMHFAQEVLTDRIVPDGNIITAGGVTAAIDLGLYITEEIAGREVREIIQKQMDYPYYPEIVSCAGFPLN